MSTASRRRKKIRRNPGRAWVECFFHDSKFQRILKRRGQRYTDHPGIRKLAEQDALWETITYVDQEGVHTVR